MTKWRLIFALLLLLPALKTVYSIHWYYPDFKYRVPIYLFYNGTVDIENVSVRLTIDTASLIAQNKLTLDCADIRFSYLNGTLEQPIPYWLNDTTCNTANTEIWVRVPLLIAQQNVTIYMYYGNPSAISESNETAVFDIFQGSYDTGTRYYDTGLYTVVNFGKQKYILQGNISINYYDSDGDTWWIRVYCDGTVIYDSGTRSGYSGYLTTVDLSGQTCQLIQVRMYDTELNDYVRVYGDYYAKTADPEIFDVTFYIGVEEIQLEVWYDLLSPINGTIYGVDTVSVEATAYVSENVTLDSIDLLLDGFIIYTWTNVLNATSLSYTITNLTDGYHYIQFVAYYSGHALESNITEFYVDLTPPVVQIVDPKPITYRIHYENTTIPIYINATDNIKLKNCTITLWNGTTIDRCNEPFLLDIGVLPEGIYNITAVVYDYVNLSDIDFVEFTIDYSQGYVVYDVVNYPPNVPAVPFNISANITCLADWCDDVKSTLTVPIECDILTSGTVILGDMEEYETKTVYWTVKCKKDGGYSFSINTTVANGYYSVYQFTLPGPTLDIYIDPPNPTEYDDILFKVYPQGYGTDVTVECRIVRYRPGLGAQTLLYQNITLSSDVNATIFTIPSSDVVAGDELVFIVRLMDPIDFYEELEKSVIVYDAEPPQILYVSLKYEGNAPHDDYQNVTFLAQDDHVINRVDLYMDFGNGTYVLYDYKTYNTQNVYDYFVVNHTAAVGNIVKLYLIAYDLFNNTAISTTYEYYVAKDNPPLIYIQQPANNSVFNTTEVPIVFRASDDFSTNLVCDINGIGLNVTSGQLASTVAVLDANESNITVVCTDEQGNAGTNFVTVYIDIAKPIIENITYTVLDSNVFFNITVVDNFLLKEMHVYTIVNNTVVSHDVYALSGTRSTVTFTKSFAQYAGQIVEVNLSVYDAAGNSYSAPTIHFAVSAPKITPTGVIVSVNMPPKIQLIDYKLYPNYIVELKFKVEDESPTAFCELSYDSSKAILGYIETGKETLYNIALSKQGVYQFLMTCTDPDGLRGISNVLVVNVSYIPIKPKEYFTAYVLAVSIKDKRLSAPFGLGLAAAVLGVMFKVPLLIMSGASLAVSGPLIVYGIIHGDPVASAGGAILGTLVWLALDFLLRRRFLI